jgi:hypothetical protein
MGVMRRSLLLVLAYVAASLKGLAKVAEAAEPAGEPGLGTLQVLGRIADLRRLRSSPRSACVHVCGYHDPADGGGGIYVLDEHDRSSADNGGTVIVSAEGARWKLQLACAPSVRHFGALGKGGDYTREIDNAHRSCADVSYPPGVYGYAGRGVAAAQDATILGAGPGLTIIELGPDSHFLMPAAPFNSVRLEGFKFRGGLGAVINTASGNLVGGRKLISNNIFEGYTHCAIDTNHGDNPYWVIENNVFDAANSETTIGVALSKDSDASVICNNAFVRNKVHLKINASGVVARISGNDFIQSDAGSRRASIWALGNVVAFIDHNKFGNENQDPSDFRIVVVPELAGATNGRRLPDHAAHGSSGPTRLLIESNAVGGAEGGGPFVHDASNNLRGSTISRNALTGAAPSWLLFKASPASAPNPYENILIEDNYSEQAITVAPIRVCNVPMYETAHDARSLLEGDPDSIHAWPAAGHDAAAPAHVAALVAGGTARAIERPPGRADGSAVAGFELDGQSFVQATVARAPASGAPLWIEFDLARGGAGQAAAQVEVQVRAADTDAVLWLRPCTVPAEWQTFRYPLPSAIAGPVTLRFKSRFSGRLLISNLRAYAARAPVRVS